MDYRKDIDGLRALAVLPILVFHLAPGAMPGGFAGVDLFFVISGYLITTILVAQIDAGSFSLLEFYRRRVARILPALLTMLVVVLAIGTAILLPEEIRDLGRGTAAAAGFVANIYFGRADYFESGGSAPVLLHSWSLGVEEQFYLFYPLLLLAAMRLFRRQLGWALLVASLGSFALGLLLEHRDAGSSFYLLPTRAWELGLGGMVALGMVPRITGRARDMVAALGVAIIAVSFVLIAPGGHFPVPWALLPCIGAALAIAYGGTGPAAALLSVPPLRAIGRWSYALYLWHWPLILLFRTTQGWNLDGGEIALLIAATFAAALLSYYLVERPLRRRLRLGRPAPVVIGGLVAALAVGGAGLLVAANAERLRSVPPAVAKVAAYRDFSKSRFLFPAIRAQFREGSCFLYRADATRIAPECLTIDPARRNVLLLGDSYAAQFAEALSERYPRVNLLQATASGCLPLLDATGRKRCTAIIERMLGPTADSGKIQGVVIAGRWRPGTTAQLGKTVAALVAKGLRVTVIGPMVEYPESFPTLLAHAMLRGDPGSVAAYRVPGLAAFDAETGKAVRAAGGQYLSVVSAECPGGKCRVIAPDGAPFHIDHGHVGGAAAKWLIREMPEI